MRLIDADETILKSVESFSRAIRECGDPIEENAVNIAHCLLQVLLAIAPTVDAVPVRHGKWKCKDYEDFGYIPCCSVCGEPDALSRDDYICRGGKIRDNDSNYCPNCGAKMDGVNK